LKRLVASALCVVVAACGGAPAHVPTPVERLNIEGVERLERGEGEEAQELFRGALAEAELVDDLTGEAEALGNLAGLARDRGQLSEAIASYGRALSCYEDLGTRVPAEVRTRTSFAIALLDAGDIARAERELTSAVSLAASLEKPDLALSARATLASVALRRKDPQRAMLLAREVEIAAEKKGDASALGAALFVDALAREAEGDRNGAHDRAEAALATDRGRRAPLAVADDLELLARLSLPTDKARAAAYWARSALVYERLGRPDAALAALESALEAAKGSARAAAIQDAIDRLRSRPDGAAAKR
jgi:tetratricopeptide (TPR) repeat protein